VTPHINEVVTERSTQSYLDPRNPARYRLEGEFQPHTQVCIIPTALFALPHGDGRYFLPVTDAVRLLRETTVLPDSAPATLTLRLRDHDPTLLEEAKEHPERLRVFRRDSATGLGEPVPLEVGVIRAEDFQWGKGPGAVFPITRFGSYVVALERE
jgi:hypothetical protein